MRKALKHSLILLLALLILLGGCTSNDTNVTESDSESEGITDTATAESKVEETETEEIVSEYYTYESARGKLIAPVIDIQTCINNQTGYDFNRVKQEMKILKDIGFTRVYFVVCNDEYSMACWPIWSKSDNKYISGYQNVLSNVKKLAGNPNRLYIQACKQAGMEAFAVFKPYEGGGTQTVPESVSKLPENLANAWIKTVGGYTYHTNGFIASNPELRIKRKPDTALHSELPVTAVEIEFILSSYRAGNTVYSNGVTEEAVISAVNNIRLWKSNDNGIYSPINLAITPKCEKVTHAAYDTNNALKGTYDYVKVRIDGLSLSYDDAKYLAVTFDNSSVLHTMPHSGFKLYSGTTELSSTVTTFVRNPANAADTAQNHEWGNETAKPLSGSYLGGIKCVNGSAEGVQKGSTALNGAERFDEFGFSFGWIYDSEFALFANSAVYGIARGTIEYIPGGLCEAYPEVREYWLDEVEKLLDCGADGIDIRQWSHSTMAIDYQNYGYNQPVVDKYRELYGVNILTEEADFIKLAKIRGDFFYEFLKAASDLTHEKGAKFAVHLVNSYQAPKLSTSVFCVGHFTDPKIILDWKKCVDISDEVTIKDNTYSSYKGDIAAEIKKYARAADKTVWVHAYLQQGNTNNQEYITDADRDSRNDGIILYEMTFDSSYSPNMVKEVEKIMRSIGAEQKVYKIQKEETT